MKVAKEKRTAEKTEYDALFAELTKGLKDLSNAVKTLKGSSSGVYGFAQIKDSIKTIRHAASMADALGHSPKHQRTLAALLQQEPEVPMQDYNFHSEEIVTMIEELVSDFKAKISEVKIDETKKVSAYDLQMQADTDEKDTAAKDLKDASELKASKMESLAQAGKDLTVTQAQLSDDQAYLKDLTEKCNLKSKEWDQRSQMRQDELTALTTALTIVKGKVAEKTTDKTVRLVQQAAKVSKHAAPEEDTTPVEEDTDDEAADDEDLSFVQLSSPRQKLSLVAKSSSKFLSSDSPRERVIALLKSRSEQLESPVLAALATKVAADPFVKIKKLIQELIERLLQEAADEANHKGWCDKEFGKAKQQRATKAEMVASLNTALSENEAKRDKLAKELDELNSSLDKTTTMRNDESAENAATIS